MGSGLPGESILQNTEGPSHSPGAILLGFALIVLMLSSRAILPGWMRWVTLVGGVAGIAGLAFFGFFGLMLWSIVTGIWLLVASRRRPTYGTSADEPRTTIT